MFRCKVLLVFSKVKMGIISCSTLDQKFFIVGFVVLCLGHILLLFTRPKVETRDRWKLQAIFANTF